MVGAEGWVDALTAGNVDQVKTVLASVVFALAMYQGGLMAVGYGKLKLPFLGPRAASFAHRAVGDTAVAVTALVGLMCLSYFGVEDGIEHASDGETGRAALHVTASFALLGVLAAKIAVVRLVPRLHRLLPVLGLTVLALFAVVWVSSAGDYLWGG
jgi:hypothetical protein